MNAPGDAWVTGNAYEAYIGRWSRPLARVFVEWLRPEHSANWLEVGCGTGALTSTVCDLCDPDSIVACDPSEPFIEYARKSLLDHVPRSLWREPTRFQAETAVCEHADCVPVPIRALLAARH